MGNQTSNTNTNTNTNANELKPKSISQTLDYIATYYILTSDFKSLRKLYDKDYCNNLVVLTSDIIERYFTAMEITYLAQRIKTGADGKAEEINELAKDNMIFFNRDDLDKLDIQSSIKKKRVCLGIAKFYIKIAHLFAAIVTTINPIYVYKDNEGNTVRANLYEKGTIPENTPRHIYKLNICDNRINALSDKEDYSKLGSNDDMNIHPKVCSFNVNDQGNTKTLLEEPGIPELMELYYDDVYDYETGKFTGMTDKTRKIFEEDLQIFYQVFTGKDGSKDDIKSFKDIKLRDYQKSGDCLSENPKLRTKVQGKKSSKLFTKYAENLKQMIRKANDNQTALLNILNELFVYTIDPQTGKKRIRVNPILSEARLQEIVVETRALIIKLYLTCEMDYTNGLKIYESIVDQKILETAQSQIENLEKLSDKIILEQETPLKDEIPVPAEVKEIKENAEKDIELQKAQVSKKLNELNSEENALNNPNNK
jgi:hypothetical protein